jgi:uncharacterized membrane protein YfcA
MHIDFGLAAAGAIVGFVVGMTGMGGGALMTPILVIFFGITPSAAVSSDLVASLVMKPFGASVHARKGTVHWKLVVWLAIGSVPAAFSGVFILNAFSDSADFQNRIKTFLGVALLLAASMMVLKTVLDTRRRIKLGDQPERPLVVKPVRTLLIGVIGGLIVGMTSVGSGSLIIVALLVLYPMLTANKLVGTDLVQAVPLVGAAALGHVLYGDFKLGLTTSLLLGAIPAVIIGARVSVKAPDAVIRPALVLVLILSSLKLLNVSNTTLLVTLVVGVAIGLGWVLYSRPWVKKDAGTHAGLATGEPAPATATAGD